MKNLKKLLENRKATYVEKTADDVYNDVAQGSTLSAEDIAKIGKLESQHGEFDKPIQGGAARGIFQFQPNTAEHLQPGSSESLSDMNTQAELMKKYLARNKPDSVEDAYAMHNLGPTGGRKFIEASDDAPIESVVSGATIRGNPNLYKVKTVGEARAKIKQKLNKEE
jgi:hypothetical protein